MLCFVFGKRFNPRFSSTFRKKSERLASSKCFFVKRNRERDTHQFVIYFAFLILKRSKPTYFMCLTFHVEPIFDFFRRVNAPKKAFFWLHIYAPFHFSRTKFCRANATEKLFLDFTQHSKPTYFFYLNFHVEPIFD